MAELGFQVSTKTADGTIFVIADATYTGFAQTFKVFCGCYFCISFSQSVEFMCICDSVIATIHVRKPHNACFLT